MNGYTDRMGVECIRTSVETGYTDSLERYLNAGGNVNAVDYEGTSLIALSARGGQEECVKLLINAGADVNMENSDGENALTESVRKNKALIAKTLIEAGAKLPDKYMPKSLSEAEKILENETDALKRTGAKTYFHMELGDHARIFINKIPTPNAKRNVLEQSPKGADFNRA